MIGEQEEYEYLNEELSTPLESLDGSEGSLIFQAGKNEGISSSQMIQENALDAALRQQLYGNSLISNTGSSHHSRHSPHDLTA